jgi:hypothetical protein
MRALWLAKKTGRCSHIALPITQEFLKKHFAVPMADGYMPTEGTHRQVILGYQKGLSIPM